MLRSILGRYLGMPPRDIRFGTGPCGKPFLHSPTGNPLHFNVAHSKQIAVYAISRDLEVGIDVEGDRDRADYRRLAERLCGPDELARFQQLPQYEHRAAFFSCWTRKEAVAKAEGTGLGFPLKQLTVSFAPDDPPRVLTIRGQAPGAHQWALVPLPMEHGFRGALAVKGQPVLVLGWDDDPDAAAHDIGQTA